MSPEEPQETIFAVDDDLITLKIIENHLKTAGYQVFTYSRALQAVEAIPLYQPDMILLDVNMAEMNGFETCQKIKANPKTSDIPIIFVTSENDSNSVAMGFQIGAVDYINKPIHKLELLARIRTHLSISRLKNQLASQNKQLKVEVNERKILEFVIERAKQEWETVFDTLSEIVVITDLQGRITRCNQATLKLFKTAYDEVIGKSISQLLFGADMEGSKEEFQLEGEIILSWMEKNLNVSSYPFQVPGQFPGYVYVMRDVTGEVIAERELRRSEERFRKIGATAQDAILLMDQDGHILYCNQASERIFGYSIDELTLKPFHQLLPPDQCSIFESYYQKAQVSRAGSHVSPLIELNTIRKDGSNVPVELSISFTTLEEHLNAIALVRDIHERKQYQQQLLASQKLANLGTLAAGLAHEINSPLQIITGLSETLLAMVHKKKEIRAEALAERLEKIYHNAWRVAEVVRALRTYVAAPTQNFEFQSINRIIEDILILTQSQLAGDTNILVETHLERDLPDWYCDRSLISQMLINLLNNAREAMPRGGKIILSTVYNTNTEKLVLKVEDTGCGIPEESRLNIFDPFYTTKPVGLGMGLGLSIVLGIVRAHQGEISVESRLHEGSTFRLSFPPMPLPDTSSPARSAGRFDDSITGGLGVEFYG